MTGVSAYEAVRKASEDPLLQYAPLVKRIAYHLVSRLPPSVQVEDLIQAGMIGLIEARRNYDPRQGASFETFASIRIRGAMLDEIRRGDWTPRSVHRRSREIEEAIRAIENREGRDASDTEVAQALGISLDEYYKTLADSAQARVFSLDELTEDGDSLAEAGAFPEPYEALRETAFSQALADAIANLPERERLVVAMYYGEEMNLKEIGLVLGVSESRVCQIHGQATLRLRSRLGDWLHPDHGRA